MTTPLHQLKADLFKALGNPMRIRVLELLCERERSVGEMLSEIGVEASAMSQQLAVLRGSGLVSARREASAVYYAVTTPQVAELLAVARRIRTELLGHQLELLSDLRAEEMDSDHVTSAGSPRRPASGAPTR
ncbi:MAG: winged helix-turn-helix transcriptional regulator [Actinomycetales bacterium]|nr:winged helix-turn-helix transcriptional regulator [Actinomycetales bacterium]